MPSLRSTAALLAVCLTATLSAPGLAQINAGNLTVTAVSPFAVTPVATFDKPWKLAFLPDGGMLVTEKRGRLWLVDGRGAKRPVGGLPASEYSAQGGLLGVFVAPDYAADHAVYLTYSEPGRGGSALALARATLDREAGRLVGLRVVWRQVPAGKGGQFGAYVAFAPDGRSLFLSSGERQRKMPAQDPEQTLGKILHLTLDGKPAPDNPIPSGGGIRAETWSTGHRNPYGLAFDAAGRLWETEMGPKGGDELNLIRAGANYGWPLVSYGINYDGTPIPSHDSRSDFVRPVVYWNPVIAPAGFAFYQGALFPAWRGSAFVGGLAGECLVRIAFDGKGGARQAERWHMGARIRDVMAGPDGALWLLEDGEGARLLRLTPAAG